MDSYEFGDVSASEAVKRVVTEQLQTEGIDSLESCGLGCSTEAGAREHTRKPEPLVKNSA